MSATVADNSTTPVRQVARLLPDSGWGTVGREFGVTRERIRQIEARTLAKLRHSSRAGPLRDYLEHD